MTHAEAAQHGKSGPPSSMVTPRTIGYGVCAAAAVATVALELSRAPYTVVFVAACVALVALAWLIGVATEELGASLGPRVGGVLNATFGNAAELIITFFALRAGLVDVVKASITGSILGNLLLVLGASLFAGGIRHGTQTFSRSVSGMNSTLLVIAVVALYVPAVFGQSLPSGQLHGDDVRRLSDGVAIVMISIYALSVIFFLKNPGEGTGAVIAGEAHHAAWSPLKSSGVLLVAAGATAWVSEILVGALEPTIKSWGISAVFAGVILVPLVGNVAEHLVGVQLALRNKMDFSIVVSLGSSLQMALFVAPVLVLMSHLVGTPMDLVFTPLEIATVALTVILVALIALDGESNWFEGAALLAVYAVVALAFFFFPDAAEAPPVAVGMLR
ncbi:MAG: calcium/proton exchanger [Chloroflexi bacterium]|nr:calcium/proton exchanger [Chloroflexota bacterium]